MKYKEYSGQTSYGKTKGLVRKAVVCFANQMRRCYTKTNPRYYSYGEMGIRVEYSKREFIQWFLDNYPKKMKAPSVGRIDHEKNYSFDNIEFQELADNSMERILRVGPTKKRRPVEIYLNGKYIKTVESCLKAAKETGIQTAHISKYCRGEVKESVKGYSLKYAKSLRTISK